jgi:hypothetical protein
MNQADFAPTPEQLVAYVDAKLDADLYHRIETWLADHPEEAAEVAAQRRLARVWQETTPAEPSALAWQRVFAGIESGVAPVVAQPAGSVRRRLTWGVGIAATAAALIWVTFALRDAGSPPPRAELPREETWEPLALASQGDVEIISVAPEDMGALLVGEPPLREAVVLARSGDVTVQSVTPDVDGMLPDMAGMTGQTSPMIVVPLAVSSPKDGDR